MLVVPGEFYLAEYMMQHLKRFEIALQRLTIESASFLDLEMVHKLYVKPDVEESFLMEVLLQRSPCLMTLMHAGTQSG